MSWCDKAIYSFNLPANHVSAISSAHPVFRIWHTEKWGWKQTGRPKGWKKGH